MHGTCLYNHPKKQAYPPLEGEFKGGGLNPLK